MLRNIKNFPEMMKDLNLQIRDIQLKPSSINKKIKRRGSGAWVACQLRVWLQISAQVKISNLRDRAWRWALC